MLCANCNEFNSATRRKKNRADKYQYGAQCLTCGRLVGTWMKHSDVTEPDSIPEWDENLAEDFWQEKLAALRTQRDEKRQEWFSEHSRYLQTQAWQRLRQRVLERCEGMCEGCRERAAAHVHHLSYAHWQRELLYELVALCEPCHRKAHETRAA